jgi:hypothetical protein
MAKPKYLEDHEPGETQAELTQRQSAAAAKSPDLPAPTPLKPRAFRVAQPTRLQAAEIARNQWDIALDPDVSKEDLVRSSFWQHYARELRRNDEVIARASDGSWRAQLLVRVVGPKDVLMSILTFWEFERVQPDSLDIPEGYHVEWLNEIANWRVTRKGDQGRWDVLRDGLPTRAAAQDWLTEHIKAMR